MSIWVSQWKPPLTYNTVNVSAEVKSTYSFPEKNAYSNCKLLMWSVSTFIYGVLGILRHRLSCTPRCYCNPDNQDSFYTPCWHNYQIFSIHLFVKCEHLFLHEPCPKTVWYTPYPKNFHLDTMLVNTKRRNGNWEPPHLK